MKDSKIRSVSDVKRFLEKASGFSFRKEEQEEAYGWIEDNLKKFKYLKLSKQEKGTVRNYVKKMTGYSRAQVTRLIGSYINTGCIKVTEYKRNCYAKIYSDKEIQLLAKTDELHDYPNGAAVKKNLSRMAEVFGQEEFSNIAKISVGHIYNLRKTKVYKMAVITCQKTKSGKGVNIGERCKPEPNDVPGYIRVDTVHQGDSKKEKGVYHINTVDEAVQWEIAGSAKKITAKYLKPLLFEILASYPFKIVNFHSDNGSEYINKDIADMLNKLLIRLTKSRPRHSNDNALAETKNGAVIRKCMGYGFIRQSHADIINDFYFGCFNEYLCYHRPCAFPTEIKDKKGKIKKVYKYENYMTPYDKLKSLPEAHKYLKKGVTFKMLDKIAMHYTDNEMAEIVQREKDKMFRVVLKASA